MTPTASLHRFDYDTVLFDVDGTLIDSNAAHAEAWYRALRAHGVPTDLERVRRLIGVGGDKLLPAIAGVDHESPQGQVISRERKKHFQAMLPRLTPTPGARALVEHLRARGITLVIATSADHHDLEQLLMQARLDDLFPRRTSSDDAAGSKPDPDIVHAALRKAGARPDRAVLIGDTPYDIEAAARAGVPCIALRCGGYWADDHLRSAIAIFDTPQSLLDVLQRRGAEGARHTA
jgi:HAD superfamily hydrolase (TIGR01509 family)